MSYQSETKVYSILPAVVKAVGEQVRLGVEDVQIIQESDGSVTVNMSKYCFPEQQARAELLKPKEECG